MLTTLLTAILIPIIILVWPVMFVARFVDAENTDLRSCLLATSIQVVLGAVLGLLLGNIMFIGHILSGIIYKYILGTSFAKGFMISIMSTLILLMFTLLFMANLQQNAAI